MTGPGKQESHARGFWQDGWIADDFEIAIHSEQALEALVIHGYLPENRQDRPELRFCINGVEALRQVASAESFSIRVPCELSPPELLRLQIISGSSFCPAKAGASNDRRQLAVVLREIQLVPRSASRHRWAWIRKLGIREP